MLRHHPVLAKETYENLTHPLRLSFDGTFWHGGHVEYFFTHLEQNNPEECKNLKIVACDVDEKVMAKWKEFVAQRKNQISFYHSSYANIKEISQKEWLFNFMLLDLWVNLEHFKDWSRGFSIKSDAPLDMRFDTSKWEPASHLINKWSKEELEEMLVKYGDFTPRNAEYVVKWIIETRKKSPIETTSDLTTTLHKLWFWDKRIAVIFQAIRIQTNHELNQLETFLKDFWECLNIGGRCAIMTYHSIEDRMTKIAFKELKESGKFHLVNKKVIQPNYKEVEANKAARSAKLRIIERVK